MTYAWIYTLNHPTSRPSLDGIVDGYLLEEFGLNRSTLLSLWPTEEQARSAAATVVASGTVVRDAVFELVHEAAGPAVASRPMAAAVLEFTGPVSPELFAAAERGFTDRIKPLMRIQPGFVRCLVCVQPDSGDQIVINFTESFDTMRAFEQAVTNSELLPDEDPALLPGPDHVAVQTVVEVFQ